MFAGHTGARPKELVSRDKADAQQALLEEAAEEAVQLLGGTRSRWSTAETWTLHWDVCSY